MSIGKNPLQYRGVRALTPPNLTVHTHAPNQYDYDNFVVGDWWLVLNVSLWYLQSKSAGISTWVEVATGSGFANSFPTDLGTAVPVGGVLNIIAERSLRNCGSTVLFQGEGNSVILNVTDVNNNTILGEGSGNLSASGIDNTMLGGECGTVTTGNFNTLIAALAGANYTSSESGNVILGSSKGTALENNVMRLGNDGTGSTVTPTAATFVSGVYGVTVSAPQMVTITATGQLGSEAIASGDITGLETDDGHVVTPTAGIINIAGGSGIDTTGTVGPNTVTISTSGSVAQSFITSPATGTAIPAAGVLTFAGTGTTTVSAAGSTVTINSSGGTNPAATCNFQATTNLNTPINNVTGDGSLYAVALPNVLWDVGGNYSGGAFSAPATGYYTFYHDIIWGGIASGHTSAIAYYVKNGYGVGGTAWSTWDFNIFATSVSGGADPLTNTTSSVITIPMNMGDSMQLYVQIGTGATAKTISIQASGNSNPLNINSVFGGYRIS